MCLIAFNWQPGQHHWLTLVGNRDEFFERPTRSLHRWPDSAVIAGRDERQGGSWTGINTAGHFAAVTNVRLGPTQGAGRSRGWLVRDYLEQSGDPAGFCQQLCEQAKRYGRFNLICGSPTELWYCSNTPEPTAFAVTPGLHVPSNASLNTPWPKANSARDKLAQWLQHRNTGLTGLLTDTQMAADDQLPDTGVPRQWERWLSPEFIRAPGYGTRSTTAVQGLGNRLRISETVWDNNARSSVYHEIEQPLSSL